MNTYKHSILFALLLWLSGCASLPTNQAPLNRDTPWTKRAQDLAAFQQWDITAVVAIRTPEMADTANLRWQQDRQAFSLLLFGPLGAQTYKLSGHAGQVVLETPQGKVFQAKSPEILLAAQTGWHLPVSNLYYWIRGLPVPGVSAHKQFDRYHHLSELNQQGWKIRYLGYTSVNGLDLPHKIFLESASLNLKIVIGQWR